MTRLTPGVVSSVAIGEIVILAFLVRLHVFTMTDAEDRALIESVKQLQRVRVPLAVRQTASGEILLMDGYRRLMAAHAAGLRHVPVMVSV